MPTSFFALLFTLGFCLLPALAQTPDRAGVNPFGISASEASRRSFGQWAPRMSAIGIGYVRCFPGFPEIEPAEGTWDWKGVDRQLSVAAENHLRIHGIFLYNAKWIPSATGFPTTNLPAYANYVSTLVKHVEGKVKYWEVWNEPPNGTHGGTPAEYAKLMIAAYDAAKAADPDCLIGLAAQSNHVNWIEQTIEAGAKDHFDYITLHPYEVLGGVNAGSEAVYMSIVPTVRKMLAVRNPAKANVPIWFTEIGAEIGSGQGAGKITPSLQGQLLVKAYSMGIAQGVACINWFEGRDGDSGPMGLLDAKGNPRPAYTAMAQMIRNLGPKPTYLGWVLLNDRDYGFIFDGAAGTVLATWAPRGNSDAIDLGQPAQVVDPLSGDITRTATFTLTDAPVLVIGVPENLIKQARANKARPFPWAGDFTDAKAVSITMGEKDGEKGLHTVSGPSVAAAVIAYGGSARAGNVPGGNLFQVDPNFLSYTKTPIEITIVVRRNPANDNAGFKLKYESTNGYKDCGWYTVPDNQKWHTITWKIDDAQFVSKWGYNFALDSDGNQYNKYFLQSVTVKKRAD